MARFGFLVSLLYFCEMFRASYRFILITLMLIMPCVIMADGNDKKDLLVISRVYDYSLTVSDSIEGTTSLSYFKYMITTNQRNPLMFCIPRLYNIAKGDNRTFFGEQFDRQTFHEKREDESVNIAKVSTIRRRHSVLPNLQDYLTPQIYKPTIIHNDILSPFHRLNRRYYKYDVAYLSDSVARISFRPRMRNTQTLKGHAIVQVATGRIDSCRLEGEFDLIRFELEITMGTDGVYSLLPKTSDMHARFSFMGNRIEADYSATYFLPDPTGYEVLDDADIERAFVESHRPDTLTDVESRILAAHDSVQEVRRNAPPRVRKKDFAKDVLWDIFGENLLHRIKGKFGTDDRGVYRISPLLNPLYFSYSGHRGLTYRLKMNGSYRLGTNSDISLNAKLGYSFKLRQMFYELPIAYTFDKKHDGIIKFSYKDGNPMTNSTVIDILKEERGDSIDWDQLNLQYFNHQQFHFLVHYDFCTLFSAEAGILRNRWTPWKNQGFVLTDKPQKYRSTSILTELTFRPLGMKGPIFTIDYERTLQGQSKDHMNYERWEFDGSYLKDLPGMRSISMRLGGGFYSTGTTGVYFLDYTNFRENNIPGGWNDEWSGEFELLHRNYYNASKYYVRMNATYESPMLLLSWVPVIGYAIEKERFYLSTLKANKIDNYIELGYGFTNRLFSMGCFVSFKKGQYDSFGCKLGFELFDGW